MIKNIINTFFFRSLNAILAFAIVVLSSRYLGAEVRGEISLFVLNVTLIFQFVSVVSGSGLVFYAPKRNLFSLIISSVIWSVLMVVIFSYVLFYLGFVSNDMMAWIIIATLLLSWFYIGMNMIVGFEKIKAFNIFSSIQMLLLTALLVYFIRYESFDSFNKWLYAYILSFFISLGFLKIYIINNWNWKIIRFSMNDFKDLINYGKWSQLANVAQLLNYRLGYYLLEFFAGKGALGVYSSAVAIAEGVWLISKSFSMVVFTRISNMKSNEEALKISFQFARISFYFSLLFIAFLLILPADLYTKIFGAEFSEIKPLLILLSPGVAVFSLSTVYAHYFSGTARPKVSSYSSLIGLICTLIFGLILIPNYGSTGVAITASISFLASGLFLLLMMLREPNASFGDVLPQRSDYHKVLEFLKLR